LSVNLGTAWKDFLTVFLVDNDQALF